MILHRNPFIRFIRLISIIAAVRRTGKTIFQFHAPGQYMLFKITVSNQFRIKSSFTTMIDFLEKDTIHLRIYLRSRL